MEQLFQILHQHLLQGESLMLLSVVNAQGSAPRGPGAHMLANQSGILTGTIGGGALEHTALVTAMEWLSSHSDPASFSAENPRSNPNLHFMRHFTLNTEEVKNLGMVCGGNVDVLFTPFFPDFRCMHFVNHVLSCFQKRELFCIALPLNEVPSEQVLPSIVDEIAWTNTISAALDGRPFGIHSFGEQQIYIEKMLDTSRVFIFGGGHISKKLVPLLSQLKFRCIVSDDRPEFSNPAVFPDAEEVRTISFSDLESSFSIGPDDYIVVLTRGHQWDAEVQCFALKTSAKYIGVIGSKKKRAAVNEILMQKGFSEADINRVITPIGLDIGAETPAEIAVSIAAQMVAVRSGKLTPETAEKFRI
ncbi:MAG: XdhC family protein [bacterium]|nr:XdhC family protein [bacterium]